MQYGLIGEKLGHSFSPEIHACLASYVYELVELEKSQVQDFLLRRDFCGINVTIPYKETVIPYLDWISDEAKSIGSVNTIINKNGKLYGYNTDYYGLGFTLGSAGIELGGKVVAVLGSGGASKTAVAVARGKKAKEVLVVSRSGAVNYQNVAQRKDVSVIINASPVGMFPNTGECLVDLADFPALEGVADMVYNPSVTELLSRAKARSVKYVNGLSMLVAQAKRASELFLNCEISEDKILPIVKSVEKKTKSITLVGMPGCGKTTIGKKIAKILDRDFYDADSEFTKQYGYTPSHCITTYGEADFREKEAATIKRLCSLSKAVIATGGGAVKREDNRKFIRSNSFVVFVKRELSSLATKGRPLSKSIDELEKMQAERFPLYQEVADVTVDNSDSLGRVVNGIIEAINTK